MSEHSGIRDGPYAAVRDQGAADPPGQVSARRRAPQRGSRADPGDRHSALLRARDPRGRGGHPHRRVRRSQGHVLQALRRQGRPGAGLPRPRRPGLDRPAPGRRYRRRAGPADQLVGLFDALGTSCRTEGYRGCGFINTAAEATVGSPIQARTIAHKNAVLAWIADLATRAGASDPATLARTLTLLLDGGLSAGALDADPDAADVARRTASQLVQNAVHDRSRA